MYDACPRALLVKGNEGGRYISGAGVGEQGYD